MQRQRQPAQPRRQIRRHHGVPCARRQIGQHQRPVLIVQGPNRVYH